MMDIRIKNKNSIRYVVRIDSNTTHGFQVRIPIKGKQVSKFFSDGLLGGKAEAKKTAVTYRDKECKRLKIDFHSKRILHRRDKRNATGKVGVSVMWRTIGEWQYKHYIASCSPTASGIQTRKVFSVKKYGDREAKRLAIEWRVKMEKKILGLA